MYAQNIKKLHPFSPDHESNMNAQARQESKLTKLLTHCGLAALLSKLLTATPAILTIWECPGIGIISGATNVLGARARTYKSGGGEQVLVLIMSLRAIQRHAARVAAGALLATPLVVTFADTVGSVGTVTGCSMRVCEQVQHMKYWTDRCI